MRKTLVRWGLVLTVFGATSSFATASYANKWLGLGIGGFGVFGDNKLQINYGIPITLEGGLYLDSGFELYLRIPFIFANVPKGLSATQDLTLFGSGGWGGVRYLFLEDSVRPYAFVEACALIFVRPENMQMSPNFVIGPGAGLGIDFFVAESVAVGAKGFVDMFVTLNPTSVSFAIGGAANVTAYF